MLEIYGRFFFPNDDFSLLESCQLYLLAKYKPIYSCKIQAVIQRCSAKKVFLNILQKFTRKPLCQSLFFSKVAA